MDLDKVFQNNDKWINDKLSEDKNYFEELASKRSKSRIIIHWLFR